MRSATPAMTVALALALAACGGKGAERPRPAVGTPYAGVFVERPAATYRYVSKTSTYDPDDPRADANGQVVDQSEGTVACATATHDVGTWQLAEIVCSGAEGAGIVDRLAARFAAGPAGIWRLAPAETADAAGLMVVAARPPLLAAHPTPVDDRHDADGGAAGELRRVHAEGAGWCVETGGWSGDETGLGICFDPIRGITKVTHYVAGGSTRDESLELVE